MIDKYIYLISVADAQKVAKQELGRSLSVSELRTIQKKLVHYINWYEAVNLAIKEGLKIDKQT